MLRGIVGKLWLSIVVLLVCVLLAMGTVLSQQFQTAFFKQQWSEMLGHGRELARIIADTKDRDGIPKEISFWENMSGFKITVVDTKGRVVYSSDSARAPVGSQMAVAELPRVLAGEEAMVQNHTLFNKDMLSVMVPLKKGGRVEGAVMLHYSLEHISDFFKNIRQINFMVIMTSITLATIMALMLARALAVPLLKMNQVAGKMAEGDFANKIKVTSHDEIGMLGETLNLLSTKLEASLSALETKNGELARLLSLQKEFVANISHELRSPLFIIRGYAEAMLDGLATKAEVKEKSLRVMLDESLRLTRLVEDLLTLSRTAQEGSGGLEMGSVLLQAVVDKVCGKYEQMADQRKVNILKDIPEELPPVLGNLDRLEQVLTNLVDNGLRYSPDGGTLTVSAAVKPEGVIVSVADQGPGIPPEELPFIWERFYKVDKARIRKGFGTGLGLAIVRNIILSHKGEIWVESKLGQGTDFNFILKTC